MDFKIIQINFYLLKKLTKLEDFTFTYNIIINSCEINDIALKIFPT